MLPGGTNYSARTRWFRIGLLMLLFQFGTGNALQAAGSRIRTSHNIGWYNTFLTFRLSDKSSIQAEYQWRREDWITHWQQSLLRIGYHVQLHPRVTARLGYGWIETFAYGEIPLNSFGKQFTEHRLFQAIVLQDEVRRLSISQRWMLEERWLGRYANAAATKEEGFDLLGRFRYLLRLQHPISKPSDNKRFFYLAAYDELFIGFGRNVKENVFDQNRLAGLIGYQSGSSFRVEAGFLQQLLQLGREVDGKNVFQYNNGVTVNLYHTLDLRKSPGLR
mgnify:FL=1